MAEPADNRPGEITVLIHEAQQGNRESEGKLFSQVYNELTRIAAAQLRLERPNHSFQPSDLIHEAFVKLRGVNRLRYQDRTHFFGVAALLMRRILLDHALARRAGKRGAGAKPARLSQHPELRAKAGSPTDIFALHQALEKLACIDARAAKVVECRYFTGLSLNETAEALQIGKTTVKRAWDYGRAWLHRELSRPARA